MKYLLWDFENTLGYREGMWSGTLHSILETNGIGNIKLEDIRPFLNIGFSWDSPDTPHSIFLNGKTWWEYMNEYFVEVYEKVGIGKNDAIRFALQVQNEYKHIRNWHIYKDVTSTLKSAFSLFMDTDLTQIKHAKEIGGDRIELYTEPYATAFHNGNVESVFQDYQKAAQKAQEIGLGVNAGHDLNLQNLEKFCSIYGILEVSIGHALIADALDMGLLTAVQEYLKILSLN
ncbi:pyridoxine 5'-phosphate synthase [Nostoc sp.]|uniref:pyridoxine 5'-phosphate synthase n=1 Tax=Nostoc sp. TaxID=1180 RepID=UPI002FF628F5